MSAKKPKLELNFDQPVAKRIKPGSKQPTVVIVGRINVGKSSLFNRLTESSRALVSKIPGTTRDYNIGSVNWRKKTFQLIDTGGINIDVLKNSIQSLLPQVKEKRPKNIEFNEINQEIVSQTRAAIQKSNLVLMVVDGQAGILPEDKELALVLKKMKMPILLVCNKIDNQKHRNNISEFFKLGLGEPLPVSAASGSGVGDFLDILLKKLKFPTGRPSQNIIDAGIRFAIVGKPNAGKSSLVNKILGEKRVIVAKTPHTTRDPQDTEIMYRDKKIVLIDTAGLRKKAHIEPGLEKISTSKTLGIIKSADVVALLTEVTEPLGKQDAFLASMLKDLSAGIMLVSNKWDLLEDKEQSLGDEIANLYKYRLPFLNFAPVMFISAKTGKNVDKILDLVIEIDEQRRKEISETQLEELKDKILTHRPVQAKGAKRPYIYGIKQTYSNPPGFTVTVGPEDSLHFSYIRYIENQIRESFGFVGSPIKIMVRNLKR